MEILKSALVLKNGRLWGSDYLGLYEEWPSLSAALLAFYSGMSSSSSDPPLSSPILFFNT